MKFYIRNLTIPNHFEKYFSPAKNKYNMKQLMWKLEDKKMK